MRIDKSDCSIHAEGELVPPLHAGYWFPAVTHADDVLPFRTGPLRVRMRIEFANYRRFGSESTIRFEGPK